VKKIFRIIFNFYLFFLVSTKLIFAQEFQPGIELFNSELDGYWEIGPVVTGYQKTEALTNYQELVPFTTVENNLDNLMLHHHLLIQPVVVSEREALFFSFSFYCETTETLTGFDQPYLLVFYQQKLIGKEEDLTLCGAWQKRYFLLPAFDAKNELILYFGEMGDLLAPTKIEVKELKLLGKKLVPVVNTGIEVSSTLNNVKTKQDIAYPINKTLHNWNEKPVASAGGQVLADRTEKLSFKDYLPPYLPILLGALVMAVSLPLFMWVSDLLVKLFFKERNKK